MLRMLMVRLGAAVMFVAFLAAADVITLNAPTPGFLKISMDGTFGVDPKNTFDSIFAKAQEQTTKQVNYNQVDGKNIDHNKGIWKHDLYCTPGRYTCWADLITKAPGNVVNITISNKHKDIVVK